MASKRKLIRLEVVALLLGAIDSGGIVQVNDTRILPHKMDTLPQINVYGLTEDADAKGTNPKEYTRTVNLGIEIIQAAVDSIDNDFIDDVTDQIEEILFAKPFLTTKVSDDVIYDGIVTTLEDTGNKVVSSTEMRWLIPYRKLAPTPSALDDFNKEETIYDMNNNPDSQMESKTNV